jgi:hypothetical protein
MSKHNLTGIPALDALYDGFEPGEWTKVKIYPQDGEDGHHAEVWTCRLPAKFTRVVVKESTGHRGEVKRGWVLSTGSGNEMEDLCHRIAKAASCGMIDLDHTSED